MCTKEPFTLTWLGLENNCIEEISYARTPLIAVLNHTTNHHLGETRGPTLASPLAKKFLTFG